MESPPEANKTNIQLIIKKTVNAPRKEVFNAWIQKEQIEKWFAPSDDFNTNVTDLEIREGGKYRIEMKEKEETHTAVGIYKEIKSPERLVFTWGWEGNESCGGPMDASGTLVTIEFIETNGTTEVTLTHTNFPDEETRDHHNEGWNGCLTRLTQKIT